MWFGADDDLGVVEAAGEVSGLRLEFEVMTGCLAKVGLAWLVAEEDVEECVEAAGELCFGALGHLRLVLVTAAGRQVAALGSPAQMSPHIPGSVRMPACLRTGLCHDLGHGPFSHAFESELLPRILPPGAPKW